MIVQVLFRHDVPAQPTLAFGSVSKGTKIDRPRADTSLRGSLGEPGLGFSVQGFRGLGFSLEFRV